MKKEKMEIWNIAEKYGGNFGGLYKITLYGKKAFALRDRFVYNIRIPEVRASANEIMR